MEVLANTEYQDVYRIVDGVLLIVNKFKRIIYDEDKYFRVYASKAKLKSYNKGCQKWLKVLKEDYYDAYSNITVLKGTVLYQDYPIKLSNVKMVILDEADEMLNMGFREDIETILQEVPEERQTLLFSATMNEKIMAITKKYLKNPKKIKIKAKELTVENIDQIAFQTKNNMKDEITTRVIDLYKPEKLIVFCNTKKKVDQLHDYLKSKKYNVDVIHGDIKQDQRDRTIKKFKKGDVKILIATDVAARGIDIANLDLVINYDIPQENEYYVHRIGRTGKK